MNLAGITQHIIQRANYNFKCFYKTEDYQIYLDFLEEISVEANTHVHAYTLMSNHAHLLVTPMYEDGVSRMMKRLGQVYTEYFNIRHCRSGQLWRERFRPCLVDAENYLLACQRYIELTPVRSGIVSHPAEYIWSSYSVNALGESSDLINPHPVYKTLGVNGAQRVETYRQLFSQQLEPGLADEIREHSDYGYCLGSDEFKLEIATTLGRRNSPERHGGPTERLQLRSSR